jgi:hypothetical protein
MTRRAFSLFAVCGLTLLTSCGGSASSSESKETTSSTVSEPNKDEATWVINTPGDAWSAAAAQTVCDLMRDWATPIETPEQQVAILKKYSDSLRRLIGSPTDNLFGASHVRILGHAEALLAYEAKYPTADVMPASYTLIEGACEDLGLTPENSKFGFSDATSTTVPSPITTAPLGELSTTKASILNALCTGIPELRADSRFPGDSYWQCLRGQTWLYLWIPVSPQRSAFMRKQYIKDSKICGEGWLLLGMGRDADQWYQALKTVNVTSTYCY